MPADKVKDATGNFNFPQQGQNFATPTTEGEAKINMPTVADVEKAYAKDNKTIEQCEDDALEALFGRPITGRLEDPQNAGTLAKLNQLVERFNTTSARLEKIEKGCQLLNEGLTVTDHTFTPAMS